MQRREGVLGVETSTPYTRVLDYDGANNPIYMGRAPIGSLKSVGVWQIQRLTFDGTNNVTDIKYANGSKEFTAVWDDRASFSYS